MSDNRREERQRVIEYELAPMARALHHQRPWRRRILNGVDELVGPVSGQGRGLLWTPSCGRNPSGPKPASTRALASPSRMPPSPTDREPPGRRLVRASVAAGPRATPACRPNPRPRSAFVA